MVDRHTLTYESVVEGKVGKIRIGHRIQLVEIDRVPMGPKYVEYRSRMFLSSFLFFNASPKLLKCKFPLTGQIVKIERKSVRDSRLRGYGLILFILCVLFTELR